jgi:O-antigen/teichoic acid export membrane protein
MPFDSQKARLLEALFRISPVSRLHYWRNVLSVLGGSALAQAAPILSTLIFARLVSPADFGSYAGWLGVAYVLGVVVTARFEAVLAAEADGWPRKKVLVAVVVTAFSSTLLFSTLAVIAGRLLDVQGLLGWSTLSLSMVTAAGLLVAMSQITQSWFAAEGRYRDLSILRVSQSLLIALTQISLVVLGLSDALVVGFVVGSALTTVFFFRALGLPKLSIARSTVIVCRVWHEQYRCPKFSLPADSLNTAVSHLPVIVVTARFGSDPAGHLAMAFSLLGAPVALLGKAVLDVFKREASAAFRSRGECRREYLHTLSILSIGSILFMIGTYLSLTVIVNLLLGAGWEATEEIIRLLLPLFVLRFVASPLSYMIYIGSKQKWDLVWQLLLAFVIAVSLFLPPSFHSSLLYYSVGYSVMYIAYLLLSYKVSCG